MDHLSIQLLPQNIRLRLEASRANLQLEWLDLRLFTEAMTTKGYLSENKTHPFRHQQWLEYLGDGILRAVVRAHILQHMPTIEVEKIGALCESLMTNVRLAEIGAQTKLELGLLVPTRNKLAKLPLADTYEALVGACHTGSGYEAARAFVYRTYLTPFYGIEP
ncbi:ribonuclease III domain-containing protein [Patescibacteria group bacterium]|nr:ribonuclease III domain-containing protein [Patescibacteria group bacterium]